MNSPYRHFVAEDYDINVKNCKFSFLSRNNVVGKNVVKV